MQKRLKREDLKVGMEVAYAEGNEIEVWWAIGKIEKIPPTGQKVVINGVSIDTRKYVLCEVTDEIRNKIARWRNIEKKCIGRLNVSVRRLRSENIRGLDDEKLERLDKTLTELLENMG